MATLEMLLALGLSGLVTTLLAAVHRAEAQFWARANTPPDSKGR
jgi:hypothetical protein